MCGPQKFDLIFFERPRTLESAVSFVWTASAVLAPGGLAVIEDVWDPGWISHLQAAVPRGWNHAVVDLDRLMFVVMKGTGVITEHRP